MEFHFLEGIFNLLIVNSLSSVLIRPIAGTRTFGEFIFQILEINSMYSAFRIGKVMDNVLRYQMCFGCGWLGWK